MSREKEEGEDRKKAHYVRVPSSFHDDDDVVWNALWALWA